MNKFECIGSVNGMKLYADGGWRITFETGELNQEQIAKLGSMTKIAGKLYFATPDVKIEPDVSDIPVEKGQKSPSARLRSRMFVSYSETHQDTTGFDSWYMRQLDEIGQKYLDRLN